VPRTHLSLLRGAGRPRSNLLGASQQWRYVRHLRRSATSRRGDPLPQVAYSSRVDRALAQGKHRRWGGGFRVGRLLTLQGGGESALSRRGEAMDRGCNLEAVRLCHCGGVGGRGSIGRAVQLIR
jgi:hypothetical protein